MAKNRLENMGTGASRMYCGSRADGRPAVIDAVAQTGEQRQDDHRDNPGSDARNGTMPIDPTSAWRNGPSGETRRDGADEETHRAAPALVVAGVVDPCLAGRPHDRLRHAHDEAQRKPHPDVDDDRPSAGSRRAPPPRRSSSCEPGPRQRMPHGRRGIMARMPSHLYRPVDADQRAADALILQNDRQQRAGIAVEHRHAGHAGDDHDQAAPPRAGA